MNLFKFVVIILLIAAGVFAWNNLGGKEKVTNAVNNARWSEEQRKNDPAGYIEYAEGQLKSQIDTLKENHTTLAAEKKKIDDAIASETNKLAGAEELLTEYKGLFKAAEGEGGSWPVSTSTGGSYSKDDLVKQVESLLKDKGTKETTVASYKNAVGAIDNKVSEYTDRIANLQAKLVELGSQKTIVKANSVTEKASELLANVDDLVNFDVVADFEANNPVKSLDDLVDAKEAAAAAKAKADAVMDFLSN